MIFKRKFQDRLYTSACNVLRFQGQCSMEMEFNKIRNDTAVTKGKRRQPMMRLFIHGLCFIFLTIAMTLTGGPQAYAAGQYDLAVTAFRG